jgi:uncharacterized protein HemX
MAPLTLPFTTTGFISIHYANTFEKLFTRAVVSKGKCEPPKCKPATPKQTMIIAICFAIGCALILALALWWYCIRGRKKQAEFHELLIKDDGQESQAPSNEVHLSNTTTTASTSGAKTQSGVSGNGGAGLTSLT